MQKKKYLLCGLLLVISSISISNSVAAIFIPPIGGNPSEKYGFFFWSSDIGSQSVIDGYESILRAKGYTTYDYKDASIYNVFDDIDIIEDYNDILFFYFFGHGRYNGMSHVCYNPTMDIGSYMMESEFGYFEASHVSILIDSCHAGEFVDRFASKNGYLVMTSSDETHEALYYTATGEGVFSDWFWDDIISYPGHSATDAFYNAKYYTEIFPFLWLYFHAQIVDNANYDFF